jgi:hypothetical protein
MVPVEVVDMSVLPGKVDGGWRMDAD